MVSTGPRTRLLLLVAAGLALVAGKALGAEGYGSAALVLVLAGAVLVVLAFITWVWEAYADLAGEGWEIWLAVAVGGVALLAILELAGHDGTLGTPQPYGLAVRISAIVVGGALGLVAYGLVALAKDALGAGE